VGKLQLPPEYRAIIQAARFEQVTHFWEAVELEYGDAGKAWLGRNDRFYLLTRLLKRPDAIHPWLHARCREVEADPDDYLDLWAREHYKSTIITFAGIIQEVLIDPEITICIFSHTKPIAKKFWTQIKEELENNAELIRLYDDVLFADALKQAGQKTQDWLNEKAGIKHTEPAKTTSRAEKLDRKAAIDNVRRSTIAANSNEPEAEESASDVIAQMRAARGL